MRKKFKPFIVVLLIAVMLLQTGSVMASVEVEQDLRVSTARLFVNGVEVATSHRDNAPFIIDGTTFLPLTAMRPALGADIIWRPDTHIIYLNDAPDEPVFVLTGGDGQVRSFTPEELLALGAMDFSATTGDAFTGVPLRTLQIYAQNVIFVGNDGFTVMIDSEELYDAYIIFEEDRSTFRLIMAHDEARGRWVRGNSLEVIACTNEIEHNISIFANGQEITPKDSLGNIVSPFMLDGMIYLPLRAVANALGKDVSWDGAENIIFIGDRPTAIDTDEEYEFTVTVEGQAHTVTMSDFTALELIDFYAVARGERRDFTGVPIAVILNSISVNISAVENLTFTAANGNNLIVPSSDALNPDYGFIAIAENSVALSSWADGGSGPFRLVLAQDQFPQRWVSNVVDITVEIGDIPAENVISIIGANRTAYTATMDDILEIGSMAVTWQDDEFIGVPLATLFAHISVDYRGGYEVVLRATDGFNAILSLDEALDTDNAFIVFERNGGPVTDDGMFALVMAQDARRNRFVRQLATITVYAEGSDADSVTKLGDYEFSIVTGGQTHTVTMDIISAIGYEEISTFAGGRDRNFTGVSFVALLEYFGVDYSATTTVRFVTADGLDHTWTAAEAFDADRSFIAFLEDGEPLGERDAPFRSILVGAPANRWMGQVQTIILM